MAMPVRKLTLTTLSAALVMLGGWVAVDIFDHTRHSLRDFDPHEVARLETRMWRSYYDHRSLRLFADLVTLLRDQYHLPFWRAFNGAYHAAHAAVVFQGGHNRSEYERALPDLEAYYALVYRASDTPFSIRDVSARELEWWIVHRERAQHQPGELEHTLAALQAQIFQMPEAQFSEHARLRAEATVLCDQRAAEGRAAEEDWARILATLDRSWSVLYEGVNR